MAVIRKLTRADIQELRDHRDNTTGELIKCYTLAQLSFMDGIDTRTVKSCGRYLPVRIDTGRTASDFRKGLTSRPYSIMWIRLDEIKFIFNKKTKKKLTVE